MRRATILDAMSSFEGRQMQGSRALSPVEALWRSNTAAKPTSCLVCKSGEKRFWKRNWTQESNARLIGENAVVHPSRNNPQSSGAGLILF